MLNIDDMEKIYGPKPLSNHAKKILYLLFFFEIVDNKKRLLVMI